MVVRYAFNRAFRSEPKLKTCICPCSVENTAVEHCTSPARIPQLLSKAASSVKFTTQSLQIYSDLGVKLGEDGQGAVSGQVVHLTKLIRVPVPCRPERFASQDVLKKHGKIGQAAGQGGASGQGA